MRVAELKVNNQTLIPKCSIADTFFPRLCGLMGKNSMNSDEAILFPSCSSIHTLFMRFPIDVVFINRSGEVVEVVEALRPWRWCFPRLGVRHTLELKALRAREVGIHAGIRLSCEGLL